MSMIKKRITPVKERHTLKNTIITGCTRRILYLSAYWQGKTHDYRMLKEEFPPASGWFEKFKVRLDLGYLGFDKDYGCKAVYLPAKARKVALLTSHQRSVNRDLASQRIGIEHSIGGLKRYRILSNRLRVHDIERHDSTLEVCAGLWNFYLSI